MKPGNQPEPRGSDAVLCLEEAWRRLQGVEPDLPSAVMVIKPIWKHGGAGSFSPSSWRYSPEQKVHEVMISPHLFSEGGRAVLAVLLHEAAHAIIYERGDPYGGCSKTYDGYQYYHKESFRDECLRLGLSCEKYNTRKGFSLTGWLANRAFPPRYEPIAKLLDEGLPKLM